MGVGPARSRVADRSGRAAPSPTGLMPNLTVRAPTSSSTSTSSQGPSTCCWRSFCARRSACSRSSSARSSSPTSTHLEDEGELDLEAATEFLVLIAALLELKSRLMLPTRGGAELDLGPEEAADELLARMLEYRRYKDAGAELERPLRARVAVPVPLGPAAAGAAPDLARGRRGRPTSRTGSALALGDLLTAAAAGRYEPHPADGLAGAPARRAPRPARPPRAGRLRRGLRPRGPADAGGDDLRAARVAQEGRGDLVAARELRPDRDQRAGGRGTTGGRPGE